MHVTVIVLVAFLSFLPARFRGQHCTIPAGDCRPLDIPRPDPNDNEDNLESSTKEEDLICARQRDTINLIADQHGVGGANSTKQNACLRLLMIQ